MRDILAIIHDGLCHALQYKNQDLLNATSLVYSTKCLILKKNEVIRLPRIFFSSKSYLFCEKHEINVPNMTTLYVSRRC